MDHKANKMLIDASHQEETRVVVLRNGRIEEFDFESATKKPLRGNIYLAKVTRVEPSLQACFVEYGGNRHGFLAFGEIHPDYYQIPVADRQALLDDEAAAEREAEQEADERAERMAARRGRDSSAPAVHADQPEIDEAPHGHDHAHDLGHDQTHDHTQDHRPAEPHGETSPSTHAAETTGHDPVHARLSEPAPLHALPDEFAPAAPSASEPTAADHSDHDDAETGSGSGRGHVEDVPGHQDDAPELIAGTEDQPSADGDAGEDLPERPRRQRRRVYKIQEVIKRRQIMLVQVVKEERGTKGAALTTYLSLAGRYTVLMPNTGRGGGISRKITQAQDRKRLKAIAQELEVPDGMGLIIRTAGASRSMPEVRRDYEYLMRLWESVRDLTLSSTAPSLVYEEGSLIKRAIRDLYTKEIDEIVVAGKDAHREAQDFMRMLMPSHTKNVILHDRPEPLFARYPAADRQLAAMFSPHVPLRSGGYLVINQTEALVAIDINSGKSTREYSIEDTALNTNLEASDEIARQLKLRDLAGLIVIDYIDMEEKRNNRAVERRLKDALEHDRARLQVGRISHFGLLEMSRQRMRTGVLEGSTTKCPHCEGSGIVRSVESIALAVLRGLEDHLGRDARSSVNVLTQADVALYILNQKRAYVMDIEQRYGIAVALVASDRMQGANFAIERSAVPVRREPERAAVTMNMGFDGSEPPAEDDTTEPHTDGHHSDGHPADGHDTDGHQDDAADGVVEARGEQPREPRGDGQRRDGNGQNDQGQGDGRRRRRRGRGRGGERDGERDAPRHARSAGEPGPAAPGPASDEVSEFSDDVDVNQRAPRGSDGHAPRHAAAETGSDDAPELINGDGQDEQPQGTDAKSGDGDDRRRGRRRRGRRGGRRDGRDGAEAGSETASGDSEAEARATGSDDPSVEHREPPHTHAAAAETHHAAPSDDSGHPMVGDNGHAAPEPARTERVRTERVQRERAPVAPQPEAAVAELTPPTPVEPSAPSPRLAMAPVTSAPEIVSDAPARPARKGWWKSRMLGE